MGFPDRYQRSREFFANTNRMMEGISRLDEDLFAKIKAMSSDEVDAFLATIKQSQRGRARGTIMFIQNSNDLETCRQALLLGSVIG